MGQGEIYKDADGNIRIRHVTIKAENHNVTISPNGIEFKDSKEKQAKKPRKKKGEDNG